MKDILPKDYNRRELDKNRLGNVVEIFSNVEMSADYDELDVLGRVYEYCLREFASQEGKNAGEFRDNRRNLLHRVPSPVSDSFPHDTLQ